MKLIDKDALVAEIAKRIVEYKDMKIDSSYYEGMVASLEFFRDEFINTLEVKEVDNVWHEVDNVNMPQPDKNEIYCVLSKNKYLLARVIDHPHDELLQWKCTEFPHHRYDMCEGDKYMQIV